MLLGWSPRVFRTNALFGAGRPGLALRQLRAEIASFAAPCLARSCRSSNMVSGCIRIPPSNKHASGQSPVCRGFQWISGSFQQPCMSMHIHGFPLPCELSSTEVASPPSTFGVPPVPGFPPGLLISLQFILPHPELIHLCLSGHPTRQTRHALKVNGENWSCEYL